MKVGMPVCQYGDCCCRCHFCAEKLCHCESLSLPFEIIFMQVDLNEADTLESNAILIYSHLEQSIYK